MFDTRENLFAGNMRAFGTQGDALLSLPSRSCIEIIPERAKNGSSTCKANNGQSSKYLHSKYSPENEADKLVPEAINNKKIIVCFGFGFGYHIEEIRKKAGSDALIYVMEPCADIFRSAAENRDISGILEDKNFTLFLSSNTELLEQADPNENGSFDLDSVCFFLPVYAELFPNECRDFLSKYRSLCIAAVISRNTIAKYRYLWNEMFYKNLPVIAESHGFYNYKDSFRGLPCIVVGAGPSLNKNVELLKSAKGKIPIISVYTAYAVLIKHGIEPDFVVSCDAKQLVHESKLENKTEMNFNLLYFPITEHEFLLRHSGRKIFVNAELFPITLKLFEKLGLCTDSLNGGGSVAHIAMDFARYAGASEIIFLGMDLSFEPDKDNLLKSHADGTFYDNVKRDRFNPGDMVKLPGINGGHVYANHSFYTFLTWIELYISVYGNIEYIDATEGGVLIKGTMVMSLDEALEKYMPESETVLSVIENIDNASKIADRNIRPLLSDLLKQAANDLPALKDISCRAEDICKKIVEIYDRGKEDEKLRELRLLLNKLDSLDEAAESLHDASSMLGFILTSYNKVLYSEGLGAEMSEDLKIMKRNEKAYKDISEAVDQTLPLINEAFNKING